MKKMSKVMQISFTFNAFCNKRVKNIELKILRRRNKN